MEIEEPADGTRVDKLPAILSGIGADGRTGVLRVGAGGEVWFSQGRTYLVKVGSSPDLADVLFDSDVGSMTEISLAMSLAEQPGNASALDQLLTERPDAEAKVRRSLHEHNLNSLFELLVPGEVTTDFKPDLSHPIGDRFATETDTLVAETAKRLEIWRRIAARIPSTAAVFTLAPILPDELDQRLVTAEEWRFLALLNGHNTVADVINATGESAFRVCSSLYRLLLENLVVESA